jgi:hypothetical protein
MAAHEKGYRVEGAKKASPAVLLSAWVQIWRNDLRVFSGMRIRSELDRKQAHEVLAVWRQLAAGTERCRGQIGEHGSSWRLMSVQ